MGADLYAQASRISSETVDAVAAVLFSLDHSSKGRFPVRQRLSTQGR